jgi:hypothetical protein
MQQSANSTRFSLPELLVYLASTLITLNSGTKQSPKAQAISASIPPGVSSAAPTSVFSATVAARAISRTTKIFIPIPPNVLRHSSQKSSPVLEISHPELVSRWLSLSPPFYVPSKILTPL